MPTYAPKENFGARADAPASPEQDEVTRLTQMRALNDRHGYRRLYEEIVLRGPARLPN